MKKVVYSVFRLGKSESNKVTGVGYVADGHLITACISKNGKPYVRVYDCVKDCTPVPSAPNEYKGNYYEIVEIDEREIEINYTIWFKYVK